MAPELPLTPARRGEQRTQPAPPADVELDYVGSVRNAAHVIASLHRGEKRLVFCDSRQLVEELGAALREAGVSVFLSHASLSADERRRSEQAFAEARDCVIVATSTLELGIDVGDLDRVIQVDCPATVAAFLQRLGRTGRRPGTMQELPAAGAVRRIAGLVGRAAAPVEPGLRRVGDPAARAQAHRRPAAAGASACRSTASVGGCGPKSGTACRRSMPALGRSWRYLAENGFVDTDGELVFIGPAAELAFGRRHFMGMTAAFTAPPQFTVISGRDEIGRTDPMLLTEPVEGPRLILLAGRSWKVNWIDWKRQRCFVEPAEGGGKAFWLNKGLARRWLRADPLGSRGAARRGPGGPAD